MEKFRGLRLFCFVTILTFALVFIGLNFVQGQVNTQGKPDKPPGLDKGPEYAWSVVILDGLFALQGGTGAAVYAGDGGPGLLYDCSQPNIYSHMRVVGPMQEQYRTSAVFEIYYPDSTQGEVLYQIDFTGNIQIYNSYFVTEWPEFVDPDLNPDFYYKPGRFPVCGDMRIDCGSPYSMFQFMENWEHPQPGYEKFRIDFYTEWFYDIAEGDYTQWNEYERKKIALGIEIHPIGIDGPYSPSEYNGIGFHTGWWDGEYGYIEKIPTTDPNTDIWKVVFGKDMNGVPYDDAEDLNVTFDEWYWDYYSKQFNKKKAKEEINVFYPTYGDCDMQFEILFIRTKQ
ncbi:MAG: hypothetical protein JSV09_09200 [Thermoplasmata archaeon]|nr:MAG: hypothetical protein JSV09_09200 [Thermoplasmata archaeon]